LGFSFGTVPFRDGEHYRYVCINREEITHFQGWKVTFSDMAIKHASSTAR